MLYHTAHVGVLKHRTAHVGLLLHAICCTEMREPVWELPQERFYQHCQTGPVWSSSVHIFEPYQLFLNTAKLISHGRITDAPTRRISHRSLWLYCSLLGVLEIPIWCDVHPCAKQAAEICSTPPKQAKAIPVQSNALHLRRTFLGSQLLTLFCMQMIRLILFHNPLVRLSWQCLFGSRDGYSLSFDIVRPP